MLHREEMHRQKPGRPPKIHYVLGKGVTSPLGKEGGIRGRTGGLSPSLADTSAYGVVQLPSHGLTMTEV